jgi:hypothetical protein
MSGIGDSCICARCGSTFEKVRSDEEALAEAESLWTPETMAEPQAVICDPCFREFMAWAEVNAPEALREPPGDPIGDALHADAEAAREEIRGEGLICPSCRRNWADLAGRHCLILIPPELGKPGPAAVVEAECRDGQRTACRTFDDMKAAANIALADEVWRQETIAFDRDITGTAYFAGLLSILEQP